MNGMIKVTPQELSLMILKAVEMQARNYHLWNPSTIGEAYILEALRDLHRVIETGDKAAFERIKENMEDSLPS